MANSESATIGDASSKTTPVPNVKINLTEIGLRFSGPTAFVSNMYNCELVYDKINNPYN